MLRDQAARRTKSAPPRPASTRPPKAAEAVDYVAIAEAAYRLDLDDQGWLQGVLEAAAPALDEGFGVVAAILDSTGAVPAPAQVLAAASRGPSRVMECFVQANSIPPTEDMRQSFVGAGPVSLLAAVAGPGFDRAHGAVLRDHGYADSVVVLAGDATGVSCVLTSPRKARAALTSRFKSSWSRAAAHIASGHRLRLHLRHTPVPPADEALIEPSGKVRHSHGEANTPGARDALRAAVLASETARGPMRRRSPEQALALWTALIGGRWSLIDRFDSDGRRFLVARRNEALLQTRAPLSQRECQVAALVALGHSNKIVSYELGLAPSTVATHLANAMTKLGVVSRVELVQVFGRGG